MARKDGYPLCLRLSRRSRPASSLCWRERRNRKGSTMDIPSQMRAAWYERTGPALEVLVVESLPTPAPGLGEVLVRIAASGVNPHDTKKRSGWMGGALPGARVVPHGDGAGTVVAVGDGVDP